MSDSENPFNIEGDVGVTANGHGFTFGGDEDVLTLTGDRQLYKSVSMLKITG